MEDGVGDLKRGVVPHFVEESCGEGAAALFVGAGGKEEGGVGFADFGHGGMAGEFLGEGHVMGVEDGGVSGVGEAMAEGEEACCSEGVFTKGGGGKSADGVKGAVEVSGAGVGEEEEVGAERSGIIEGADVAACGVVEVARKSGVKSGVVVRKLPGIREGGFFSDEGIDELFEHIWRRCVGVLSHHDDDGGVK